MNARIQQWVVLVGTAVTLATCGDIRWRFAGLYIWNRSRDTTTEPFTTGEHIVDLQVKRVW